MIRIDYDEEKSMFFCIIKYNTHLSEYIFVLKIRKIL